MLTAPPPVPPAGMLDLKGAHEWVVTTKLGSSDVRPGTTPTVTRNCRLYGGEMAMSAFVLGAAFYGVFTVNRWTFSIFLFLQVRFRQSAQYIREVKVQSRKVNILGRVVQRKCAR